MKKVERLFYAAIAIQATLSAWVNSFGPYHRDGSFFLFMAQQIIKGVPPYYSVMDSKNPLVEYYWAAFNFISLPFKLSMEISSRIAEAAWIACCIFIIYKLLVDHFPHLKTSIAIKVILLICQFSMNFWKFTDNGFNISLYQSLFEFLSIWITFKIFLSDGPPIKILLRGLLLGVIVFLAWMVKQSSLISIIPAIAFLLCHHIFSKRGGISSRKILSVCIIGPIVSSLLLLIFFSALKNNGTFDNYWAGTFTYNAALSSQASKSKAISLIADNLEVLLTSFSFISILLWTYLLATLMLLIFLLKKYEAASYRILLVTTWFWSTGVLLQTFGKLTFFNHYFLALIVPLSNLIVLLLPPIFPRIKPALVQVFLIGIVTTILTILQLKQTHILQKIKEESPMVTRSKAIAKVLPIDAKVFNWSGFMHFFVDTNRDSYYEMNQWWFYIVSYHWQNGELDRYMQNKFKNYAPDYIVEQREKAPEEFLLTEIKLNQEMLERWTSEEYEVILHLPSGSKRYEHELFLYKKK